MIGATVEFEREIIRERVIAGLRQAKRNGKKLGRPRVQVDIATAHNYVTMDYLTEQSRSG